jgi:preprotein translocase subunit YajC
MDNILNNNSLAIVLIISLIVWIGICFLIIRVDRKLSKLEKQTDSEVLNINE